MNGYASPWMVADGRGGGVGRKNPEVADPALGPISLSDEKSSQNAWSEA